MRRRPHRQGAADPQADGEAAAPAHALRLQEDTDANLQPARDNNVCECWLVNRGEGGISVAKLEELTATFAALAQNVQ